MAKQYVPKVIAPRLANGDSRETIGHGLPPEIKEGLRRIASKENKSVSWVLEIIIIDYFGFRRPQYLKRKTQNESKADEKSRGGAR